MKNRAVHMGSMEKESWDQPDSQLHDPAASARFWDHARRPRFVGQLEHTHGRAVGVGSCGDSLQVGLCIRNGCIAEIAQLPKGCVYTAACGSAMCELAKGRDLESALQLEPEDIEEELGGLPRDHLHCARLAVNTLGEAIADYYHHISRKRLSSPDLQRGSKPSGRSYRP